MARGFAAVSTVAIDAPRAKVWDALTIPASVKQYMHGTNLTTDWEGRQSDRLEGRMEVQVLRGQGHRS